MRRNSGHVRTPRLHLEALEDRRCPSLSANEIQVNTVIAHDQAESANASSANGSHVVVWTDHSAGNANIKAQRYLANGHRAGGEIVVANTAADEYDPAVAMDAGGNFVVVWTAGPDGGNTNVMGARFAADGTRLEVFVAGDSFAANAPRPDYVPSVAMAPDGKFVVSHTVYWGDVVNENGLAQNNDVIVRGYNADGTALPDMFVDVELGNDDGHSSAAAADSGFAIAYDRAIFGGVGIEVRLLLLGADLSVQSDQLIPRLSVYELGPSVAMDNDGSAVVAYVQGLPESTIVARRVGVRGVLGDEILVPTFPGTFRNPAVALDPTNDKFVVAYDELLGGGNAAVHVREVSAFDVVGFDHNLGDFRSDPAISIGGNHDYLVTYTKVGGEKTRKSVLTSTAPSGTGVFGRLGFLGDYFIPPLPFPSFRAMQDGDFLWIDGE